MIGRLTGRVIAQEDASIVVVDVGGVGYELSVPAGTVGRAKTDPDGRTVFFVHTHVREDALQLFGFPSDADRVAFRTLIGVSNVGPKTAIAILSALPAGELARAVAAKELKVLTSIPGVGKKTAERLLLELRDKLPILTDGGPSLPLPTPAARPGTSDELLVGALTSMGYRPSEAERAVTALSGRMNGAPLPELIREALAVLAK
jgi:Holliday junction DNA helicase RuvA